MSWCRTWQKPLDYQSLMKMLTSAREITINVNDFPRYLSTFSQVWIDVLKSNSWYNISIRGHWWKTTIESKETCHWGMQASRYLTRFLNLVPRLCVEVDMNRLIEGGPWCFPHHRHETQNNHVDFEVMRQPWNWLRHDRFYRKVSLLTGWILGETSFEQFVAWQMTWKHWLEETRTRCNARNMTKHYLNWLKGVRWLTKVD